MAVRLLVGDALTRLRELPDRSVQCCVTSPPYWGLRDYGTPGQMGLEPTPDQYLARMVEVFREVKRVLRDDGTCWVNMGDSYASAWACKRRNVVGNGSPDKSIERGRTGDGLKEKDLCGIPWRLAFALQADGWWLRQDIIWAKPNPMPESVTDRCTKAHEYLFLLSKRERYYYDAQAIAEPSDWSSKMPDGWDTGDGSHGTVHRNGRERGENLGAGGLSRNARSVWTIPTSPFPDAHFATFPPELPRRCILAGTSEKGCCQKCGAPRMRMVERTTATPGQRVGYTAGNGVLRNDGDRAGSWTDAIASTVGWHPSCSCDAPAVPCVVLDPFAGAGTTLLVADRLNRDAIGIELNPTYAAMAEKRIRDDAPLLAEIAAVEGTAASLPQLFTSK